MELSILMTKRETMKLDSGHEATDLEGEELLQQERDFTGYKHKCMVRFTPGRWIFLKKFTKYANDIYNFKWRTSDVALMTYPKCGTTWTQEIIWTMRNNKNFDHPHANEPLMDRVPFFEADMFFPDGLTRDSPMMSQTPSFLRYCPDADPNDGVYLQMSAAIPDPRTIKIHLPFSLLHPAMLDTAKVVYVVRNPKDVVISYCHHSRLFFEHGFQGSLEDFYKYFINGDLLYGPYEEHVKEAWERLAHPNLHFMFYEDMQADIMKELRGLNEFLDTQLTEEQLKKVADYTSFESMKERGNDQMKDLFNPEVYKKDGGFFRKGKSGDWKKRLTPELAAEMDSWTAKHFNFGITFK